MRGLETGADDYLGKPCEPRELTLRIASILRRATPRAIAGPPSVVRFGDFSFDIGRGELRQRDEIIRLTDREREMLRLLAENAGETVAREALAGSGVAANERTVDVQVNRLRRKIERDPGQSAVFANRAGRGLPFADRPLKQLERGRALSLSLPVSFEQPRSWWRGVLAQARLAPAQGPLCARASDRHCADGDPAMRAHLCVHGTALAARSPCGFQPP